MSWKDFTRDNAIGRKAELQVRKEFEADGWTVTPRNLSESDMLITKGHYSEILEIKNEEAYENGQNVCVEMVQVSNGVKVPSGLWHTEATIVIHQFKTNYLFYRSSKLLIDFHRWWHGLSGSFERPRGPFGDNGNDGFLVKKSWLKMQSYAGTAAIGELPRDRIFQMSYRIATA